MNRCAEKVLRGPLLLRLCVDHKNGEDIGGRIYYKGAEEPVTFCSTAQMFRAVDRLCDEAGGPQSDVVSRTFHEGDFPKAIEKVELDMQQLSDMRENNGGEATFVIHIKYRQNATWQGKVTWAERNKSCDFRSALELLKLIDSALDEEEALSAE